MTPNDVFCFFMERLVKELGVTWDSRSIYMYNIYIAVKLEAVKLAGPCFPRKEIFFVTYVIYCEARACA